MDVREDDSVVLMEPIPRIAKLNLFAQQGSILTKWTETLLFAESARIFLGLDNNNADESYRNKWSVSEVMLTLTEQVNHSMHSSIAKRQVCSKSSRREEYESNHEKDSNHRKDKSLSPNFRNAFDSHVSYILTTLWQSLSYLGVNRPYVLVLVLRDLYLRANRHTFWNQLSFTPIQHYHAHPEPCLLLITMSIQWVIIPHPGRYEGVSTWCCALHDR